MNDQAPDDPLLFSGPLRFQYGTSPKACWAWTETPSGSSPSKDRSYLLHWNLCLLSLGVNLYLLCSGLGLFKEKIMLTLSGLEITKEFFIGILVSAISFLAVSAHRKVKSMFKKRATLLKATIEDLQKRKYSCNKLLHALADASVASSSEMQTIVNTLIDFKSTPNSSLISSITKVLNDVPLYKIPKIKKYTIEQCRKDREVLEQFLIEIGKVNTRAKTNGGSYAGPQSSYLIENVCKLLPLILSKKGSF